MGLGAENGGWVLLLVEYRDLGVPGWVLGNKGEDGFERNKAEDGGWVLVWGVRRVGSECFVMEWGVKRV